MPPSNRTDADDLAVAVILTLELANIALAPPDRDDRCAEVIRVGSVMN